MSIKDFFKHNKNLRRDKIHSSNEIENNNYITELPLDAYYTPDNITFLGKRDIFVFGSNLSGHHAGGAAKVALNRFGALWGQGEGLQGNSYAIPTMQGGIDTIKPFVDRFIEFAKYEKALTFYVTKIGCGIAGFKINDIAPLFKEAIWVSNIRLPKEFRDIIVKDEEMSSKDLFIHSHGVTRTFADLVIERNKDVRFRSPDEVMSFLNQYFERFKREGDDIAFISVRILWNILHNEEVFKNGELDIEALKKFLLEFPSYSNELNKAYEFHCREKLFNLIVYLNQFRKYRSSEEISNDVNRSKITHFSHCGPNCDYYMSPIRAGHGYPLFYFKRFIEEKWDQIQKEDGTLDPILLDELMFNRHERGLRKYGIEAVLAHDYNPYPCWGAFLPKIIGTGPVYIDLGKGKYAISCGEGAGPNNIPHYLEYTIATRILETDSRYECIQGYFIPKDDMSLPILGTWRDSGIMEFANIDEKIKFILNLRQKGDKSL